MIRPDLLALNGFSIAQERVSVKLDQNEAPEDVSVDIKIEMLKSITSVPWNRYPQPSDAMEVREQFATEMGISPDCVCLTAGADQGIYASLAVLGGPHRSVRIFHPTYPVIPHIAKVLGMNMVEIFRGPRLDLTPQDVLGSEKVKVLVSPNNPTGEIVPREVVLAALSTGASVVVDEAYAEFSGESALPLLNEYPNLVIIRSLSKSGLAGMRLGFVVARPQVVATMEKLLLAPYHLNHLQWMLLRIYGQFRPQITELVARICEERERMYAELVKYGFEPLRSSTNFLLFRVTDPSHVFTMLVREGVRVRNVSTIAGLNHYLRVTIGTRHENDCFLKALISIHAGA